MNFKHIEGDSRQVESRRQPRRIGVLIDWLHAYTHSILREVVRAAEQRNVQVICFAGNTLTPEDLTQARHPVFDLATAASVDGILLLSLGSSVAELEIFANRFRPVPLCTTVPLTGWPHVIVDNEAGLREVIGHLIGVHHHRRIAFVQGPERNPEAALRYQTYLATLGEHGIEADPALVVPGGFSHDDGIEGARRLLEQRRNAFSAVVCANDASALGLVEELLRQGVEIPDQVAVVGFDDMAWSAYADPRLTTVRQPTPKLAQLALATLLSVMDGDVGSKDIVLHTEAIFRQSCGCPAYDREAGASVASSPTDLWNGSEDDIESPTLLENVDARAVRRLHRSLVQEIRGEKCEFLANLRLIIAAMNEARVDLRTLHDVVTRLDQSMRRHAPSEQRRANALLQAARIIINGVRERGPAQRFLNVEKLSTALGSMSHAVSKAIDLQSLGSALATHLPICGVRSCYVCRHEPEAGATDKAELVLACDDRPRSERPPIGMPFPSCELLPKGILDAEPGVSYLVRSLDVNDDWYGYIVLEASSDKTFVYDVIVEQVEAAFRSILLLDQFARDTRAREAAEARRAHEELLMARRIQTGVLPRNIDVPGLEISAAMRPATEVGGDYYDILQAPGGCWLGIGDVAGHGLRAGLVMLMVQTVVAGLVRSKANAKPSELLLTVNDVVYQNVRDRLEQDEHVTLTLLRYHRDGGVSCAGAHEDILICRADGRIEWISPLGTWIGARRKIDTHAIDTHFKLEDGDLMVLYTDGVTEAPQQSGERFGPERLAATLLCMKSAPVEAVRDAILAAVDEWTHLQEDDITVLVARYRSAAQM
jgi:sigma-B regulation protein RsbU (phosphoserine phosphatase)